MPWFGNLHQTSLWFSPPVVLSCFQFFSVFSPVLLEPMEHCARRCAVWQSSSSSRWGPDSSRWVSRAQRGSSFPSFAAHRSTTAWPYCTLISGGRCLSFFVCLAFSLSTTLHFVSPDKQKTHVWQRSSEGRAFVPGSRFVLVLLCFIVQSYISKQTMHSCFHNDAFLSAHIMR